MSTAPGQRYEPALDLTTVIPHHSKGIALWIGTTPPTTNEEPLS